MSKGVVILAVNKPVYGQMAYNLAQSIKLPNPDIKIQLIYDEEAVSSLSDNQINVFDDITNRGLLYDDLSPGELKTKVYELSSFDKTLFIDADSIMFPFCDLNRLFDSLDGCLYQPFYRRKFDSTKGDDKLMYGFTLNECKEVYPATRFSDGNIYEVNSHFMYFEKDEMTKWFFEIANMAYNQLTEGNELSDKIPLWQGVVPDEAAFSISTYMTGMHPSWDAWQPIHDDWPPLGPFNHVVGAVGMVGKNGITMQGEQNADSEQFYDYVCMLLKIKYRVNDLFKWEKK